MFLVFLGKSVETNNIIISIINIQSGADVSNVLKDYHVVMGLHELSGAS